MNTNVKAVINLMQTLNVTLEDIAKELQAVPSENKIIYKTTKNGFEYAMYNGKILGLLFRETAADFILSLYDNDFDKDIADALIQAENYPAPTGYNWSIPEDWHFQKIVNKGLNKVNSALEELGGNKIGCGAYLSLTSQNNPPKHWTVRFILLL